MTAREQLLQELEQTPDDLIEATLEFLRSAKAGKQGVATRNTPPDNPFLTLLTEFDEFAANIPPEELAHLPRDGAQQQESASFTLPSDNGLGLRPDNRLPPNGIQTLLDFIDSMQLTPEEIASLPQDGAENHDHYLYGAPKQLE